jgi:putative ABC transport system permease protein
MNSFDTWLLRFTADWRNPVGAAVLAVALLVGVLYWEQTRFMLKSLRRNPLRSALTGLTIFVLVLVVTLVWSVLAFLDRQTEAKSRNLKAIISEKYQLPSMMPFKYEHSLAEGAPQKQGDYRVNPDKDSMFWSFYVGTTDPARQLRESFIFFFCMDPRKLISVDAQGNYSSMMDDIDDVSDEDKNRLLQACEIMTKYPNKVLVGPSRLKALNKRVGDKIKATGIVYSNGLELEVEVLGELPGGRYEQSAIMNFQNLDRKIDEYNRSHPDPHPMSDKRLMLMWVRVPDMAVFEKVAGQIASSPDYKSPEVKCETGSSGIATFLDPYKDLLFGMRWLLVPAILITMALVIANAISISVRERRTEMAVLKVLGYTPNRILVLVLGEALLIGCVSGVLSAVLTRFLINYLLGGITLPIAFFGKFYVESAAPWWGLTVGAATALVGSILPAWTARSVKVSEVFAKVA